MTGEPAPEASTDDSTVFESVGGASALLALAHAWHERCLADEVVSHAFSHPGQHPQHIERLAAYWGEALGGPAAYTQSMGTQKHVIRLHAGNGEHREMDDRAIACFAAALDDVGVDDARTRDALLAYFTSSTRALAEHPESHDDMHGDPLDDVPDDAPVPRWAGVGPGWGGAEAGPRPEWQTDVMNEEALARTALRVANALPAATQSQPFGEGAEVLKVVGKVFAIVSTEPGRVLVTLKCAPPHGRSLIERYESVTPGYHMNKQHWISIRPGADADETLVEDLVGNSYDIVVSLLPRDKRPLDGARRA